MPLVELPGFDERVRRHCWAGSRAVAVYKGRRPCVRCSHGEVVRLTPYTQAALFYHGGYGATERVTADLCLSCGRVTVAYVESVAPR